MDQTLKRAKQIIRSWVKHFEDQKLCAVAAFNEDGKMRYGNPCCCILGVTGSARLHVLCDDLFKPTADYHYRLSRDTPGGVEVEEAYRDLAPWFYCYAFTWMAEQAGDRIRQRHLSAIIRAEMRRRERVIVTHLYQRKAPGTDLFKSDPELVSALACEAPKRLIQPVQ